MTEMTGERWEQVYRDSFPRVYRALVATLFDRELAMDALQEAFLRGLERPPEDRNPEGWLFRVALRYGRRSDISWSRVLGALVNRTPDGEIAHLLDRLEVGRLLRTLSERQRTITIAHYYLGMTQEEIAEAFHVKRGTVGATIAQALKRMRGGAAHAS